MRQNNRIVFRDSHFARWWLPIVVLVVLTLLTCGIPMSAFASCSPNQQTCSSSYGVNEAFFGTGGQLCIPGTTGSTHYCAKQSAGETGVGNTVGGSFQAYAGFNTNREPSLTFCVYLVTCGDSPTINLGTLTAGTTATATAKFAVESYLASGYIVSTVGNAPNDGGHTMTTLSTPTAANSTQEQFGMNLVANNSCGGGLPGSLGASPVQVPDSTFSFGAAAHNNASDYYDTACKFMYQNGDTIATSAKSSGETDYTISYIFNTTNVTPGGYYTFNQTLVATSTF